jgi:hypothetical protein
MRFDPWNLSIRQVIEFDATSACPLDVAQKMRDALAYYNHSGTAVAFSITTGSGAIDMMHGTRTVGWLCSQHHIIEPIPIEDIRKICPFPGAPTKGPWRDKNGYPTDHRPDFWKFEKSLPYTGVMYTFVVSDLFAAPLGDRVTQQVSQLPYAKSWEVYLSFDGDPQNPKTSPIVNVIIEISKYDVADRLAKLSYKPDTRDLWHIHDRVRLSNEDEVVADIQDKITKYMLQHTK